MHIVENKSTYKSGKKIYNSILLRESFREEGKVKKRTIANLSHCQPEEIAAMKLALKHKNDLTELGSLKTSVELEQGLSVGAVWTVYQVAKKLGIEKALGTDFSGKLALWQVIARVIDQGSRLSAVRLAQAHAACEILDIRRGFDENNLYDNLKWLDKHQEKIERDLFFSKPKCDNPQLFLYDVTSSYLEGEFNYFGAFGYSRDKKRGKKQIVIGLLCDSSGDPVSTEVFPGNTQDPKTFASQIRKAAKVFGCKSATFVGDRGMIKNPQIEDLPEDFHYITAITKPQIESLIKKGVMQFDLFDEVVCEVEDNKIRYILRHNPVRAAEVREMRVSKEKKLEKYINKKNDYLKKHPRASVSVAEKDIKKKVKSLKLDKWLELKPQGRVIGLEKDDQVLMEVSQLDGCYAIKTDLSKDEADKQVVHDRYKDLALVEKAFRDSKTVVLDIRPIYVRREKSTRAHSTVVMLAYKIIRKLRQAWEEFDLTVEEGLDQLSTLCSTKVQVRGQASCLKIPRPRKTCRDLLEALNTTTPIVLPHRKVNVVTRKKLKEQRKGVEK